MNLLSSSSFTARSKSTLEYGPSAQYLIPSAATMDGPTYPLLSALVPRSLARESATTSTWICFERSSTVLITRTLPCPAIQVSERFENNEPYMASKNIAGPEIGRIFSTTKVSRAPTAQPTTGISPAKLLTANPTTFPVAPPTRVPIAYFPAPSFGTNW